MLQGARGRCSVQRLAPSSEALCSKAGRRECHGRWMVVVVVWAADDDQHGVGDDVGRRVIML